MDYTDGRFNAPPSEGLESNFGRMPVATIGNQSIGQSAAINYYFAAEYGLMGKNNIEAAQIISVAEHLKEMKSSFLSLVTWGVEPKPEALDQWFDQGSTDIIGTADRKGQSKRYLKWYMGRLEPTLNTNGYAVGNQLSLADVLLYNTFMDTLELEQRANGVPNFRCEPFCNKERTELALAQHPRTLSSCHSVAAHPHIKKWLGMRGVQMF